MLKAKLVLTGGQCAGKTTLVKHIKWNCNDDNKYIIVPETATMLYRSSLVLDKNISNLSFQKLMILIQYYKEAKAERLAKESRGEKIIICDRGILDSIAYIDKEQFNAILKEYNLEYDVISQAYDQIVFMESLAVENPLLFKERTRGKNVKLAVKRNEVLKTVYKETGIELDVVYNIMDYMDEKARIAMSNITYAKSNPNRKELEPMSKKRLFKYIHEILASEGLNENILDEYLKRNGI